MSFFTKKLGIDLGTANTLIFAPKKGVVLSEPSVVAVSEIDNKILAVGIGAKKMIGRTPESVITYRPMKDGVIADYRVTEVMLRYYINKVLGKWNFFKPEVIISVPAGITSTERRAVIEATIKAGAKKAFVVKEPILAAIGAGVAIEEAGGHMIVDIGGGTIDVAVISLGGIVASTSVKCAGDKMNETIIDFVKRKYNLSIGDKTAEEIKIKIGSALPLEEELSMEIRGRDFISGLPRTIEVKTNEVAKALSKDLREIIKAIKTVFQETPPELSADIVQRGIIMTGGSSQLRNLPELIYRRTGVKACLAKDSFYCVSKGTGVALEHLDVYRKSVILKRY
ncbi:MAG: rod shape-determining protein [Candidatus Pacebacteria bacterium]|nr:rod shape-determining protein [Candidatus Paceibacterota bacterium]